MEKSTQENEAIVSRIYEEALGFDGDLSRLSTTQRVVYLVEHLMQEVNSGASFEQYFRWATVDEIKQVQPILGELGLSDVQRILSVAIDVAFPDGFPQTDEQKEDFTDWSEEQEEELEKLFNQVEDFNGRVTNTLGHLALRADA